MEYVSLKKDNFNVYFYIGEIVFIEKKFIKDIWNMYGNIELV